MHALVCADGSVTSSVLEVPTLVVLGETQFGLNAYLLAKLRLQLDHPSEHQQGHDQMKAASFVLIGNTCRCGCLVLAETPFFPLFDNDTASPAANDES